MIILEYLGLIIVLFLVCCICYTLVGFLCGIIPKNKHYKNTPKDITIYLTSDGLHTDFILPAQSAYFNWKNIIDDRHYETPFSSESFLGIGWGDRGFYLDIEAWKDLTPKVAFKAMLIPSCTLMHVISHKELPKDKKYFEQIHLSKHQYLRLCKYISSYFKVNEDGIIFIPGVGYTTDDNFYESSGTYHAFNTCNFWVNKGLILIGVRMPIWSHWGGSMFYQLKKAD